MLQTHHPLTNKITYQVQSSSSETTEIRWFPCHKNDGVHLQIVQEDVSPLL